MPQSQARVWWADVQHLRETFERGDERRAASDRHDLAARRAERERLRWATEPLLRSDDAPAPRGEAEPVPRSRREPLSRPQPRPQRPPRLRPEPDRAAHPAVTAKPASERRTIQIRGQAVAAPRVPPLVEIDRRRPPRRPVERVGARPDRLAMWALLLGIVLILVAVGTADAAVLR